MLVAGLGAALAVVTLTALVVLARGRRHRRTLALRVATHIEPYLRRKAAEAGLPPSAPVWTARSRPDDVVGYSVRLADELLARERAGPHVDATLDTDPALARTVPLKPGESTTAKASAKALRR